jgi:flagellin-specific chaperone FliS
MQESKIQQLELEILKLKMIISDLEKQLKKEKGLYS